jgi:cytochrome P450
LRDSATVRGYAQVPPAFPGPPIIRNTLRFKNDAPNLFLDALNRYGDIVRMRIGRHRVFFLAHPDHVRHVLSTRQENYPKAGYDPLEPLIGNGLLRNESDSWRTHKRLMQPYLRGAHLTRLVPSMAAVVERVLHDWRRRSSSGPFVADIDEEMTRIALGIVSATLFGQDLGDRGTEIGEALGFVLGTGVARITNPLSPPLFLPTPTNVRLRRALGTLDDAVYSLIDRRRMDPSESADLLSHLVAEFDPGASPDRKDRDRKQLRDEIMTLLTAGHETTAKALCWALLLLSRHPDFAEDLAEETRSLLGGSAPGHENVVLREHGSSRLNRVRMLLDETLRLYPPVVALARAVREEDEVNGCRIPAGSRVIVSQYATHRHPRFWDDPESFVPERFTPEHAAEQHRYAYFPFGAGPRACIGSIFATVEAQVALAMIVREFEFRPADDQPVELESRFTLRPRNGLRLLVARRGQSPRTGLDC